MQSSFTNVYFSSAKSNREIFVTIAEAVFLPVSTSPAYRSIEIFFISLQMFRKHFFCFFSYLRGIKCQAIVGIFVAETCSVYLHVRRELWLAFEQRKAAHLESQKTLLGYIIGRDENRNLRLELWTSRLPVEITQLFALQITRNVFSISWLLFYYLMRCNVVIVCGVTQRRWRVSGCKHHETFSFINSDFVLCFVETANADYYTIKSFENLNSFFQPS